MPHPAPRSLGQIHTLYYLSPQPHLISPGVSGRHKAGGWRETDPAPQVLTGKRTDCEITPGLDNLPPYWNPWGTEIINLLISYTLLFSFLSGKKHTQLQISFTSGSYVSHWETSDALEEMHFVPPRRLKCIRPSWAASSSPPLPTRPGGHTETECFWRCRVLYGHATELFHLR